MNLIKRLRNLWELSQYSAAQVHQDKNKEDLRIPVMRDNTIEPRHKVYADKPIRKPGMAVIIKARERDPIDELVEQINQQ